MKAILKLKNKKLILDFEFGYSKIPQYIKAGKKELNVLRVINTTTDPFIKQLYGKN